MEIINNHSAGIDIGSRNIYIGLSDSPVKVLGTFTKDFKEAGAYLREHNVTSVAMEATGSYWVILYDILIEYGLDVWLVDGRQTRQVPGRKTDVKDCQWIQPLHSYGLLNRCFVAEGDLKEARGYQCLREDHIRSASMHINHMQKALIEMNIRLPEVLDQIHGASGIAIIRSILAGERNPQVLLSLYHSSIIKRKSTELLSALEGYYTDRGICALRQAYQGYMFYQKQISECDNALSNLFSKINKGKGIREVSGRKAIRHHKPDIDGLGKHMLDIFEGRDATILPGITDYSWMQIYSETGSDLERWASEKHFTGWLGLSPGQNNSGKTKKRVNKKGKPAAGQIFRTLAQALLSSNKIAFGAFGRRLRGRKGPRIAVKAVARKIAAQYWRLMVKGKDFIEQGIANYQQILLQQKAKYLNKLALELNVEVIPIKK